MPTVNLSGTRNVRYPDPRIKRVAPNGTQEYSAYQALFIWYWPDPPGPDPLPPGYYPFLTGLPGDYVEIPLSLMLFGTDYPASVTVTSVYHDGGYFEDGTANQFRGMTFNETAASVFAGMTDLPFLLQNGPSFVGTECYKRILTGPTVTNGVTVSGFTETLFLGDHGLYDAPGSNTQPTVELKADVLLNCATVHSTTAYQGTKFVLDEDGNPIAVPAILRIPVILHEPDLTQKIKDDGYIIEVPTQFCGPMIIDVVGIWGIEGYSPVPVPPPPVPPVPGPDPADVGARSFAAPASAGVVEASARMLAGALAGMAALNRALGRRK